MSTLRDAIWKRLQVSLKKRNVDAYLHRPDYHYVPSVYGRTARKHVDIRTLETFGRLAKEAIEEGRTCLFYDRLYPIYQSLENIRRIAQTGDAINTAEVGVYRGGTSRFIATVLSELGCGQARHHGFDTFEGHAESDITEHDPYQAAGDFSATSLDAVRKYLQPFGNVHLYQGRIQDTAGEVNDRTFHFAHLDVDIYEPMLFSLRYFGSRLAIGGTMVVDDFGFRSCPGVEKAVREFLQDRRGFFPLHLLSGQCVLVKHGEE